LVDIDIIPADSEEMEALLEQFPNTGDLYKEANKMFMDRG